MFMNIAKHVSNVNEQVIINMLMHNMVKLVIILPKEPFQKWGLDFIELIKPTRKLSRN
jgi:hypothetical protein